MARAFQAPDIPEDPKAQARAVSEAFIVIAAELAALRSQLAEPPKTRALDTSGATILPAVGDTLRLKPPAAGAKVTLPASNAANKNQTVTIIVEGTAGNVVVSAIDGLVQFGASVTLIGRGSRTFISDGGDGGAVGGWWLEGGPSAAGAGGWPAANAIDPSSGAFNPIVNVGQFMQLGLVGPAFGQLRSGDATFRISSGGTAFQIVSAGTVQIQGTGAFVSLANTSAGVQVTGATTAVLQASGGTVAVSGTTGANMAASAGAVSITGSTNVSLAGTAGFVSATAGTSVGVTAGTLFSVTTGGVARFQIESTGAWDLAGVEGVAAQVLTSNGPGVPPTWQAGGGGGGALTLLTTEVNLGTGPTLSGTFTIAGAGMTIGKPVLIQQAAGPYTGKGTLVDECEDQCTVTAIVTSTTAITAHWEAVKTPLAGNVKFDYAVSA